MEFIVVRDFIDKNTNVLHKENTPYKTEDQDRANKLIGLGFIKEYGDPSPQIKLGENPPENGVDTSILSKNVSEITPELTSETPKSDLKSLLEAEKTGENRKTIIKHIVSLLEQ